MSIRWLPSGESRAGQGRFPVWDDLRLKQHPWDPTVSCPHLLLKTALLRYNSHIIKFTHLKSTVVLSICWPSCATTTTTINCRTFSYSKEETPQPFSSNLPLLSISPLNLSLLAPVFRGLHGYGIFPHSCKTPAVTDWVSLGHIPSQSSVQPLRLGASSACTQTRRTSVLDQGQGFQGQWREAGQANSSYKRIP